MRAILNVENGIYHLDWNGNHIEDRPSLIFNGLPRGRWYLIDILLNIFRSLPQEPSLIWCGPTVKRREQLLETFCIWAITTRSQFYIESLNNSLVLDGCTLPIEVDTSLFGIIMGDGKRGDCFIGNIGKMYK